MTPTWSDLEQRFSQLQEKETPFPSLHATVTVYPGGEEYWTLSGSRQDRELFEADAKIAGRLCDATTTDPIAKWLQALCDKRLGLVRVLPAETDDGKTLTVSFLENVIPNSYNLARIRKCEFELDQMSDLPQPSMPAAADDLQGNEQIAPAPESVISDPIDRMALCREWESRHQVHGAQTAFCRRHSINVKSFGKWKRSARNNKGQLIVKDDKIIHHKIVKALRREIAKPFNEPISPI